MPILNWLRAAGLGLALAALVGCTPQAALVSALLPDGTVSILLSHLEGVDDANRRRIVELESRADWDGLAKFAEDNLAKDRRIADWWLVAGYAHSRAGRHPRAIECYGEMVRLAPDDMLGWSLLAQSYRAAGQPQRAVQALNNALLVRRDDPQTWFVLGGAYSDLGRIAEFDQALRALEKLDPGLAGELAKQRPAAR